jgi:hypothetical protein
MKLPVILNYHNHISGGEKMRIYQKTLAIILILGGLLPYSQLAWAQTKVGSTAVNTLSWQNSARTKAMGGCSVALIDAQSQFSNPAAMGVFALDNILAINVDSKTQGVPESDMDGIVYKTRSVMARLLPYSDDLLGNNTRYAIAAGYTYSSIGFTMTQTGYEDWNGSEGLEFNLKDFYYEYSGSIAFRTGPITAGAGYTEKKVSQDFPGITYKSHCYDIGVLASLQLMRSPLNENKATFDAAVSFGYVRANVGSITLLSGTYDFPKTNIMGISAWLGYKNGRNINLAFMPAFQFETFEEEGRRDIKRFGLEAGFDEAIFGRIGYSIDEFGDESPVTFGFGLSSRGLYNNILYPSKKDTNPGGFLAKLDIRFDYARSRLAFFEKTNFYHISLSL